MTVLIDLTFADTTLEQYDGACRAMNYQPRGHAEPDALFHVAYASEGSLRVVDVWTSPEAFEKFVQEKLGPATAQLGIPQPKVEVIPLHDYMYSERLNPQR